MFTYRKMLLFCIVILYYFGSLPHKLAESKLLGELEDQQRHRASSGKIMVEPPTNHRLHMPPRIQKQLKNMLKSGRVKTHREFEHAFSVNGLERSISVGGSGSTKFAAVKPQIVNNMQVEHSLEPAHFESSRVEGPERIVGKDETNPCKGNGYTNCSIIDTPEHSMGVCEASNHCVPLKFQRYQFEIHFPECVVLKQCLGHCCGTKNGCVAHRTQPVFVKVRKYAFTGMRGDQPNIEFLHDFYSEMEEHLDCKCADD